jgi:hypothetical protein
VESIRALKYGTNQFNSALKTYGNLHSNYTNNDDDVIEYLSVKTSIIKNDLTNVKKLVSNMCEISPICFNEIRDAIEKVPIIIFFNNTDNALLGGGRNERTKRVDLRPRTAANGQMRPVKEPT